MENFKQLTLGEIVTKNYKTSVVFQKYGLDFCCNGNRNLVDACNASTIDPDTVVSDLSKLDSAELQEADFNNWPIDALADHIYNKHHRYIEEATPAIKGFLDKICKVHGNSHEELHEIRRIFYETSGELAAHMKKEEMIIFPYIKNLIEFQKSSNKPASRIFDTVASPISKMKQEHLDEGEQLLKMNKLSNQYTTPPDGCTTYRITYKMLQEYELDMHMHIHLENNILFPKAIQLEQELLQKTA